MSCVLQFNYNVYSGCTVYIYVYICSVTTVQGKLHVASIISICFTIMKRHYY